MHFCLEIIFRLLKFSMSILKVPLGPENSIYTGTEKSKIWVKFISFLFFREIIILDITNYYKINFIYC